MDRITRPLLARAGEQRLLSAQTMDAALDLAGLRPAKSEWRRFAVLAMRFAAILSLAAGLLFLVAFNWEDLGLYARFAMVEAPLLAALIIAWVNGADTTPGKLALTLAVLLTGGLLALFGQTYQTGANLYELFFGWAALALPWVIACRYAPCWAIWLLLINIGIGLLAATSRNGFLFSLFLDRWRWSPWSLPYLLDLLIYAALIALSRWNELGLGARWLRRGVMAVAMAFGTIDMMLRIIDDAFFKSSDKAGASAIEFVLFLAATAGFAAYAFAQKEDLFNFAVLALAWIVVTTTMLGRALAEDRAGVGALFFTAIYVIAVSTAGVKGIAYIGRQWKLEEGAK
jgi:uncharacterized membrane protein